MEEGQDPDEARRQVLAAVAKEAVQKVLVKTPKSGVADSQNLFEARSLEDYKNGPPPLGLKLKKTPSAVKLINQELDKRRGTKKESKPKAIKFPAVHFPASSLRIGDFSIEATYQQDLMAGCYYATRKLAWKILDKRTLIMNKIVVAWENILAMQVDMGESRPGILEIELHKEPMFYQEADSEARSHGAWKLTEDFTGGQAFTCRRHYIKFPPGVLKEHYERMIQCDKRLRELSQRPFPSLESPYFGADLLYQRATNNPHSHAYAGSNNDADRHHQQPAALVTLTQQPQQFGSTIASSQVYSTAPTSDIGSAYIFNNNGILEDPNMAHIIQECDDHANIWATNSMSWWASECQQHGNFSDIDMCLKDFDFDQIHLAKGWKSVVPLSCHMPKINSSSTSGGLSMKVNPDFNSNYSSTQIANLPTNTRINSTEAFTCEREHCSFLNNGNVNDMVLSHQGRFKRSQALHFTPLQVPNYLLPHTLNLDCSTRQQDDHGNCHG